MHGENGSHINHDNINQMIGADATGTKQVGRSFFAQIAPAYQGSQGKGN